VPLKDNNTATHLFRIAQEAVTNGVMHGQAQHIVVGLKVSGGLITLSVRDDGVGLPGEADPREGTGLRIMEYRASLIGASLGVGPGEGGGTLVTCKLRQQDSDGQEE
jgi:signal transduction histidine kinase